MAIDAHQQADVVGGHALVPADSQQVRHPQRDPRLADRVLERLATPQIGRVGQRCHELREPHAHTNRCLRVHPQSENPRNFRPIAQREPTSRDGSATPSYNFDRKRIIERKDSRVEYDHT
jgi:hypothetical protein